MTSWNFSRGAIDDVGGADWHIRENADGAPIGRGREAFAGTAPIIADVVHQRIEDNLREIGARQTLRRRLLGRNRIVGIDAGRRQYLSFDRIGWGKRN